MAYAANRIRDLGDSKRYYFFIRKRTFDPTSGKYSGREKKARGDMRAFTCSPDKTVS